MTLFDMLYGDKKKELNTDIKRAILKVYKDNGVVFNEEGIRWFYVTFTDTYQFLFHVDVLDRQDLSEKIYEEVVKAVCRRYKLFSTNGDCFLVDSEKCSCSLNHFRGFAKKCISVGNHFYYIFNTKGSIIPIGGYCDGNSPVNVEV